MKNEMYNLGKTSKNLLEKEKRLQESKAEYLKQYAENLKNATELKEAADLEHAMSAARFSYASTYANSKNRVNKLNEQIKYNENSSLIGMTEMVAEVVEGALLLDEDEYSAINPTYKEDMRDVIFGLLKEGDVNEKIRNKDTLAIMEYVARKTPNSKEGINLTEDELANYIAINKPENINKSISNLSSSVSEKVAQLMEKEQAKVEEIESEVSKAKEKAPKKAAKGPSVKEVLKVLSDGEISEEDLEGLVESGEISEEVYNEVIGKLESEKDEVPEEALETEEIEESDDEGFEGDEFKEEEEMPVASGNPKKQIQLTPDGTINVNIFESDLIRETPRCGLLESLAVNEAQNLLAANKEYNPDLCLANAIMYVTITEALNEMGLITVDDLKYKTIVEASGGKHISIHEGDIAKTISNIDAENARRKALGLPPINNKLANEYVKIAVDNQKTKERMAEKREQEAKKEKTLVKESLNETVLCSQGSYSLNRPSENDLAERIRQRKLLKEQNNQLLNE